MAVIRLLRPDPRRAGFPEHLGFAHLSGVGRPGIWAGSGDGERVTWIDETIYRSIILGLGLGILSGVLYIFFYLSFSSQAAGVLPYVFPPTRLPQYLVMFGTFIFLLTCFLVISLQQAGGAAGQAVEISLHLVVAHRVDLHRALSADHAAHCAGALSPQPAAGQHLRGNHSIRFGWDEPEGRLFVPV